MSSSQSVPSLDESAKRLQELGVWSDILPDVNPSQLRGVLEVRYPKHGSVAPGEVPDREAIQDTPKVFLHNASDLKDNAKYTLIMTDPDLMTTNDPIDKQVRHWVQPGLTISSSGELSSTRGPHTSFLPSAPMPMTGAHRYIFVLAQESKDVGTGERGGEADFKERLQFKAQDFITENGLTVVGVTGMKVEPNLNAGIDDVKLMAESAQHAVTG